MKKLLSILLTTTILFGNEGSNYFVDNFLKVFYILYECEFKLTI